MILTLVIPGEPVAYMRVTRDRSGRAHVPAKMRRAQDQIGKLLKAKYIVAEPYDGMVSLKLLFYCAVEKDWDNLGKLFCDALNGVLWVDDRQVKEVRVGVLPPDDKGARTYAKIVLWDSADVIEREAVV